jgi:undecaprenyl-diphosphatase
MAITYVIFDKVFILNVRPNGSGEASFPSTHVMIIATIFLLAAQNLKYYVKSKALRVILIIVMLALATLTCFGRVLSNMHWLSDVLGGLAFALIFNAIYFIITKKGAKNE